MLASPLAALAARVTRVSQVSPQGEVARVQQIVVRFDAAVVTTGDPRAAAPYTWQCNGATPAGSARWINDRQWVYDLPELLSAGQRCTLDSAPDFAPLGGPIVGANRFSFSAGAPTVISVRPFGGARIEEDQHFLLRLNGAAELASVLASVWCEVQGLGERIPVKLIEGPARTEALLDLANAYRMLARQGRLDPVRWRAGAPQRPTADTRVLSSAVAWQVGDRLSDPAARAATFGLDSPLVTRGWAAVKTGTSKDLRDNGCVGFTKSYTVAVWVGNAGGQPMHGVSGVSGAAPVWRELMTLLHAQTPSLAPARPPGLVTQQGECFVAGTEPGRLNPPPDSLGHSARGAALPTFGIQAPRDGSVIVLDPDIPMLAQRLVFEGAAGQWFVAGRLVGQGSVVHGLPRPGRFVLERRSAEGGDGVEFEVRAAPF